MDSQYLIGVFDEEESMLAAFRKMKEQEIEIEDVFTPYPVHEILEKHGRKSRITIVGWFYGFFATLGVLAFLILYSSDRLAPELRWETQQCISLFHGDYHYSDHIQHHHPESVYLLLAGQSLALQ